MYVYTFFKGEGDVTVHVGSFVSTPVPELWFSRFQMHLIRETFNQFGE